MTPYTFSSTKTVSVYGLQGTLEQNKIKEEQTALPIVYSAGASYNRQRAELRVAIATCFYGRRKCYKTRVGYIEAALILRKTASFP